LRESETKVGNKWYSHCAVLPRQLDIK